MSTITLTGKDVLKLKKIDNEGIKDKNGLTYWKFAKGSTVFIAREEFVTEWTKGNVAEVDLEQVEDKDEDNKPIIRLSVGGFVTNTQEMALARHQAGLKMVEKVLEKEFKLEGLAETV